MPDPTLDAAVQRLRLGGELRVTIRVADDVCVNHCPELVLRDDALVQACVTLDATVAKGLCAAWGVASWDPSALLSLIDTTVPRPAGLMVRAGLLVGARTLDAADALTEAWGLEGDKVWGMSPFGGCADTPVWGQDRPTRLPPGRQPTLPRTGGVRAACHLPRVGSVAVGTNEPAHLGELVGVPAGGVDERTVQEYRSLLRDRSRAQPA